MSDIINATLDLIHSRPGMDPRNYISGWPDTAGRAAYRADQRTCQTHRKDALALASYMSDLTRNVHAADASPWQIMERNLPGGRLTYTNGKLHYCAGQYHATEYRAAVCRALAQALLDYFRDDAEANGMKPLPYARAVISRRCGRGVANRWFR